MVLDLLLKNITVVNNAVKDMLACKPKLLVSLI